MANGAPMIPVTIAGIVTAPDGGPGRRERFFIMLESAAEGDNRRLFIGVGDAEATALAFGLQGQEFPRPMTYQFMAALVAAAGSSVRSVRVTRIADEIFYAQVTLRGGAVVDARPSDAINLAATTGAPVLVASELLDLPTDPRLKVLPAAPGRHLPRITWTHRAISIASSTRRRPGARLRGAVRSGALLAVISMRRRAVAMIANGRLASAIIVYQTARKTVPFDTR